MNLLTRLITTALVGVALSAALNAKAADAVADKLKTQLQSRLGPDLKSVTKAPISGWYEVNLGSQLLYSDEKGRYLFVGDLLDLNTRENLTVTRLAELNQIDFASLPLERAVKVVKGNGGDAKRRIVVFSDPVCPYCKQLEKTLVGLNNATIYTFLSPILSPDSMVKAKAIWCAPNRAQAWQAWATKNQAPSAAKCDTSALTKNIQLARELNITGTPTVIFANGRRLSGALSLEKIEQEMSLVK